MTQFAASTHPGVKRDHNEDCFAAEAHLNLWLVADGVGGHSCGEVASAIVKSTVLEEFASTGDLQQAIHRAHETILREITQRQAKGGMGSTVVAMSLKDENYDIVWVGDSRAYLWDGRELRQVTWDHSHVQSLVSRGVISSEEAKTHPQRNVLTQSLGISPEMELHPSSERGVLEAGQQIILCSDGLNDELSDEEIAAQMRGHHSVQAQVDGLINAALEAGGGDNITVIVVGAPAPGNGNSKSTGPDMEITQNIGQAVLSKSEARESHSAKVWVICLLLFALVLFLA